MSMWNPLQRTQANTNRKMNFLNMKGAGQGTPGQEEPGNREDASLQKIDPNGNGIGQFSGPVGSIRMDAKGQLAPQHPAQQNHGPYNPLGTGIGPHMGGFSNSDAPVEQGGSLQGRGAGILRRPYPFDNPNLPPVQVPPKTPPKRDTSFEAATLIGNEATGGDNGKATVVGEAGKTYSILSDTGLEFNALFDTLAGDGVGVTQTAINIPGPNGSVWSVLFKIEAGPDGPVANAFLSNGEDDPIPLEADGKSITLPDGGEVSLSLNDDGSPLLVVLAGEYAIQQQIGPGPSIAMQVETGPDGALEDGQKPTGFLGQSIDARNSAKDDFLQKLKAFETEDPNLGVLSHPHPDPVIDPQGSSFKVSDLQTIIDSVDFDGDGVASAEELQTVAQLPLEIISAQAQFLLAHIDEIGQDGKISKADIQRAAQAGDPTRLEESDFFQGAGTLPSSNAVLSVAVSDINTILSLADTDGNGVAKEELQQIQSTVSGIKSLFSSLGQGLDGLVDNLLGNISSTAQFMLDNFDALAQPDGDLTTISQADIAQLKGVDGDTSNISLHDLYANTGYNGIGTNPGASTLTTIDLSSALDMILQGDDLGNKNGVLSKEELQQEIDQANTEVSKQLDQLSQLNPDDTEAIQLTNEIAAKQVRIKLLQSFFEQFDTIAQQDGEGNTISVEDVTQSPLIAIQDPNDPNAASSG